MERTITVLIVDDHAVVRQGVRAFLETQPDIHVVAEAASGEEAVRQAERYAPDVVLMDLVMPGMDGVAATRAIKRVSPRSQVIVLTSYHDDEHIFPAIRAGALSYLLKDVSPDELATAVRRAAQGEAILHPRVAARLVQEIHAARVTSEPDTPSAFEDLTERELEVLRLIAQGLSNAAIAQRLYISERTVKSHVSNILSKLHLADRTQAAVYAWKKGLMRAMNDEEPTDEYGSSKEVGGWKMETADEHG
ncbi:MAG: response regulator transcription factor [Chloroflexi bacterium]|nr:response regulator transcription factor [Chloroflexota bacterium]